MFYITIVQQRRMMEDLAMMEEVDMNNLTKLRKKVNHSLAQTVR